MEAFRFVLFLLAALTSIGCTWLLLRAYTRIRVRLLFWTGVCFVFLSASNVLLFIDTIVLPTQADLRILRFATSIAGVACLLYAFIWEAE